MNLLEKYNKTRQRTIELAKKISVEDSCLQVNYDVSPVKWQLGHTTWFFDEFVLKTYNKDYDYYDESFLRLFNSYYENKGEKFDKYKRYMISRPSYNEIMDYRNFIDNEINKFIPTMNNKDAEYVLQLGLNHEQQHQELILTDTKLNLFYNPNATFYNSMPIKKSIKKDMNFYKIDEGLYDIGHCQTDVNEFALDIEYGYHKRYIEECQIADRLVTNGEYLEFIKDGGYQDFNLWHADAWAFINRKRIKDPLYWIKRDDQYFVYSLHGFEELDLNAPVTHITYYEAWAFAKWAGCRLPTEFEHEIAENKYGDYAKAQILTNPDDYLEPVISEENDLIGGAWSWTESAFLPYPRYKQAEGALGEYNGKFMINMMVLRGACSFTPDNHYRTCYRNFYMPEKRWMLSGIRLVK